MRLLKELADQLMLGSERRLPMVPALPEALGGLLAPQSAQGETGLLRVAGAVALCSGAGFVPAPDPAQPAAPAPDAGPVAEAVLVPVLAAIMEDGPDPLRMEAMALLAGRGLALPPRLLPHALALAARTPILGPALAPVLGTRGRWLAVQNEDWSALAAGGSADTDLDHWHHGSPVQRLAFLGALRAREPDRARSLLEADFSRLDARERAALLEALATGLGPADEDFLQAGLADRSKEVRSAAAGLLSRMPESAYVRRMGERLAPCLNQQRKFLRQVWVVDPPESFGADWKADAIEDKRPKNDSLGERAWWLYQLARALPLSWWTARTGMTPAEATKWAAVGDWSEALFRAWGEVLLRQPDPDWARAFLGQSPLAGLSVQAADLLACLPADEQERYWLDAFRQRRGDTSHAELLAHVMDRYAAASVRMSEPFARRLLEEARKAASRAPGYDRGIYALCQALPGFACRVPAVCLEEAGHGWPAATPETEYIGKALARTFAIIEQRKTLHRHLSDRKPS